MIQDIFPHKFDNHFLADQSPAADDIIFAFSDNKVLCRSEDDSIIFPRISDFSFLHELIYLFSIDERRFFLDPGNSHEISNAFEYRSPGSLRKCGIPDRHLIFAAITAEHLNNWYASNKFCGRCAQPLIPLRHERALMCPVCKNVVYPRIDPAIITGVANGDFLLLTKYAGRELPYYALVAGFAEIGESFEETVKREVKEEVGLDVTNIRYYKSQPWGFSGGLLAGYFCDVIGDPAIKMDTHELKEAVWMPRADIPGQNDDFSLTNEMMLAFRDGYR